jgi:hypothetical protein
VEKKELVERDNEAIAVARQCELLRLSRSSYYYSSTRDDEYNLELMRLMALQAIYPHKRRSFLLPGFNKKGYFFATMLEDASGPGILHAL